MELKEEVEVLIKRIDSVRESYTQAKVNVILEVQKVLLKQLLKE